MNIFISHSSKNADYGNALVDLLTSLGIKSDEITFTSNNAYGIATGNNIFKWLKTKIKEKPHVIYLLSPEYYRSIACLNEMGAAWIVENEHTIIFTPSFNIDSKEFQTGVLDPREMGFYINDEEKIIEFIDFLKDSMNISPNSVLVNQKVKGFLTKIGSIKVQKIESEKLISAKNNKIKDIGISNIETSNIKKQIEENSTAIIDEKELKIKHSTLYTRLKNDKFEDEDIMLLHYIIKTKKRKLLTGWQEYKEIENIEAWEQVNDLNNLLSANYHESLKRFEMLNFITVSKKTISGNEKEMALTENVYEELLNLPKDIKNIISKVVENNPVTKEYVPLF